MDPTRHARLLVVAGAILFSTGGAAIKSCAIHGWALAGFRSAIAAALLLLILPSARRVWSLHIVPVALAYAATLILFILANKLTTAANSIFLQAVAPLYLLLLGPWLLKEPVGRADFVFMAAFAAGLTLFFVRIEPPRQTAPDPFLGNILAAISGVTWALVLVGLRWLGREGRPERGSPAASVAFGNLIAFAVCLPWTFPLGQIQIRDWLILGYLGVFQVGLAYVCVTLAMRRLGALEASLLILVEPALNPVWAWLVHGEKPGALALAGGVVIMVATAFRVLWRPRRPACARQE